jgi:ApaG protein
MGDVSTASTEGIRVTVSSMYLPQQSSPDQNRFVFAYTVVIVNEGGRTAQLLSRHWIITDARGRVEEVRGAGVVGEQPRLAPGQAFQYTSGCVLRTARGTMHGTYHFVRDDGSSFDAEIAPFALSGPAAEAKRYLN